MKGFGILVLFYLFKVGDFAISFEECNKSVNCLKYPQGCKSFTTCKSVALYFFNKETSQVHIQLTSKDKWVAFGQVLKTAPNYMTELYGAYCVNRNDNKPDFGLFTSPGIGHVNYINASDVAGVKVLERSSKANYITCLYSRPLDAADFLHPMNDNLYLGVIANGNSLKKAANGLLGYHASDRMTSENVINWTQNPESNSVKDKKNKRTREDHKKNKRTREDHKKNKRRL